MSELRGREKRAVLKRIGKMMLIGVLSGTVILTAGCKTSGEDATDPALVLSEYRADSEGTPEAEETPETEVISEKADTEEESEKKSEKQPKVEVSKEEASEKETKDSSKTPLEIHGQLSVSGNHIVDEHGKNFQICGVSTHGLGWFPQYVNKAAVKSLRDDIGANTLRLAMYTAEGQGYCTGGDKNKLKNLVNNGVSYATENGMYAIIDWHILQDLDPNVYKDEAKAFFDEMSKKYAGNKNVLYEICNEPNGGTTWAQVKADANEVIPVIRANDKDAIIIVGTPNWSQDVDEAVKDPITGYDNIVYAVHFYADTHKDNIRNKVKIAEDAGYPVLISEFSICDASGNGNNNIPEANTWIKLLDSYGIGFVAWNLSNKNESSSIIAPFCQKTSGWSYDDLSQSGQWLVGIFDTHSDQGSRLAKGQAPIGGDGGNTVDNGDGNNGGNDGNNGGNNGQTVAENKSGNLKASVVLSNSWQEGSSTCSQYSLIITNSGSASVSGWTITLDLGTAPEISQIWGGKASVSGNTVTVTPESYNPTIEAGKSLTDVGLIVKTSSAPGKITVSAN
jgi:endoglucanase